MSSNATMTNNTGIRNGFPYIKASVLAKLGATATVKALVPNQFLRT